MAKPIKCGSTNCPLYGSQIVPYDGNKEARVVVVGESPGRMELIKGKPFQGDSGDLLKAVCKEVGLNYQKLFIANACRCQVKKDEMSAKQIKASIDACRGKLAKALELLKPKAVIVLGDIALKAVLKKSGITKARKESWVWSSEFNCWVLPTFHPAYILRNMGLRAILKGDILRVQEFVKNGYKPLTQEKTAAEGYEEVDSLDFLLPRKGQKTVIGLDTETQGIDWTSPNFVLISASLSDGMGKAYQCILHKECEKGSHDFSITWPRRVDGKKKTENVEVFIRRASNFVAKVNGLRKILESDSVKKFMANGNFDRHAFDHLWKALGKRPPKLKGYIMDIQAGAHVLDENMYKMASLQDLQFAMTDMRVDYKQDFEKSFDKSDMLAVLRDHPEEFNYYSMSDADVTRQVGIHIVKQLKRPENTKLLRYFTKMVMPGLNVLKVLETNGALIDAEQLPKVTETVTALVDATQEEALATLPPKLLKAHEDKGLRLTRDDLVRDALFSPQGFKLPGIKRTKGNDAWSVDKETRILLLDHPGLSEEAQLFIHKYDEFSESHTMLTRYLRGFDKAIKTDGRIHSSYSLTVAVTGRASSRNPNMMNNPKRSVQADQIRRLIKARNGYTLLAVDQGQCLVPETELVTTKGIKTLEEVITGRLPVLSCSPLWKLSFQPVLRGWSTGLKAILRIHFDNGTFVDCSPRHRFRLWNGEWAYASDLKATDRMAHVRSAMSNGYPYFIVGRQGNQIGGVHPEHFRKHRLVGNYWKAEVVHHKRKDKSLWWDDEVVATTVREHAKHHSRGIDNPNYGNRKGLTKVCPICGRSFYRPPSRSHEVTDSKRCSNLMFPRKIGENMKVVAIEKLGHRETFQIEVATNHTYVLANGLVSKNSELRWAAHLSGDPEMIRIFRGNRDIHTETAMNLGGYTPSTWEKLSDKDQSFERRKAKAVNFGLLYKMSAPGFVRYAKKDYGLDLSVEEAELWIKAFFGKYRRLLDYHQRMINFCRQHGYVESPLGRRRRLPEIHSKNPGLRNEAERQAVNSPIQGASSDVVLLAADEIEKKEYDPVDIKDCLFIHDELVFEIRDCSKLIDYAADIKKEMEHPPLYKKFGVKLKVPLVTDIKIGDNLAEMTALEV